MDRLILSRLDKKFPICRKISLYSVDIFVIGHDINELYLILFQFLYQKNAPESLYQNII
uniref:Uncharacterized protein n=1 Tax=viral metagenome TaxID=1070528 RepID=A0A6C0CC98_9ZZZZ